MNKTICLGMIVKNEEANIKQTLESIKSIIDYWVICDTGSTDDTEAIAKEVLKGIPGEYVHRTWVNFGYNRSEVAVLTKDKADYTLMLDGDFTVCFDNFNKEELDADVYDIQINWGIIYNLPLLLNNKFKWKSIGAIHEYWQSEGIKTRKLLKTITINHQKNSRRDFNIDIKLLLEEIKNEPNNTRCMFYLCQTYFSAKQYDKTIEWGEKRIAAGGWNEEIFHSMLNIIVSKINLNHLFEEIFDYGFKTYFYSSNNAEPLYLLLNYCRTKKLYHIGYYIGKIAERIPMPTNKILFVDKTIYDYKIKDELSICAYWIGKYQESLNLCNQILELSLSENNKNRIKQNKQFCEQKLGISYNLEKFKNETAEEVKNLNYNKYFYQYTESQKIKLVQEMKETQKFFKNNLNLDLYPVYGTLLGMIRDKDFIGHDTDIDMAYLSKYHTEKEVLAEFHTICNFLKKHNILIWKCKPASHIHIYSPSHYLRFDLWISWIGTDGKYYLVWMIDGELNKEDILPFNTIEFKGQKFLLISQPKKYLDFLYKDWQNPIAGGENNWNKRKPIFRLEPWQGK